MRDLLIGILSPVLMIVACCAASVVVLQIASAGVDMARVQKEDDAAHGAATKKAAENQLLHGQSFAPVR